jgi:ADP-ribose pyrophosphatase
MKWEIIEKALAYSGFFKLSNFKIQHELFAGGISAIIHRELIDKGQAVAVLPYDPVRDEVVLIEQFRIGACDDPSGPWLMEIIAGYLEPGETPESVAIREAIEEADCQIHSLQRMHQCYSAPGGSNEMIHLYFALTDTSGLGGIHGLEHEGEDIRVHVVKSETAFQWLDQGKIDSAMPVIALQWFRLNRDRIRTQHPDANAS